jgi:hypothetical protein
VNAFLYMMGDGDSIHSQVGFYYSYWLLTVLSYYYIIHFHNKILLLILLFYILKILLTSNPDLANFLLCVFLFASTILVLNLLIALMNRCFRTIEAMQAAEWNRERARIITEQWRPWGRFLFVCMYLCVVNSVLMLVFIIGCSSAKYEYYIVRSGDRKERLKELGSRLDARWVL